MGEAGDSGSHMSDHDLNQSVFDTLDSFPEETPESRRQWKMACRLSRGAGSVLEFIPDAASIEDADQPSQSLADDRDWLLEFAPEDAPADPASQELEPPRPRRSIVALISAALAAFRHRRLEITVLVVGSALVFTAIVAAGSMGSRSSSAPSPGTAAPTVTPPVSSTPAGAGSSLVAPAAAASAVGRHRDRTPAASSARAPRHAAVARGGRERLASMDASFGRRARTRH
jgi:hypothetical protein